MYNEPAFASKAKGGLMNRQRTETFAPSLKTRARLALTGVLAAALALPLGGCFGVPSADEIAGTANEVASQAGELASQAQELAGALSNVEWGKVSRLVVKDAASGEVVREVTDQGAIEQAFAPLSSENGLATAPEEPAEYTFELWEPETIKAGQDASDVKEYKGLEATTYEGSPVVTIEVSPIGLKLHISSQAAADSLRALAG